MILAQSELPTWALPVVVIGIVVQFGWSGVISFSLYILSKRDRGMETMEKQLAETELRLHETATKLVDERFRAMTHELNNHVQAFVGTLDSMKERLRDGEASFDKLNERDHMNEIKAVQAVADLKLYLQENAASKNDLKGHQEAVESRFSAVEQRLDNLGARRSGGTR